jgi:hypothetical protein
MIAQVCTYHESLKFAGFRTHFGDGPQSRRSSRDISIENQNNGRQALSPSPWLDFHSGSAEMSSSLEMLETTGSNFETLRFKAKHHPEHLKCETLSHSPYLSQD